MIFDIMMTMRQTIEQFYRDVEMMLQMLLALEICLVKLEDVRRENTVIKVIRPNYFFNIRSYKEKSFWGGFPMPFPAF